MPENPRKKLNIKIKKVDSIKEEEAKVERRIKPESERSEAKKSIKIPKEKLAKKWLVMLVVGIIGLIAGIICFIIAFLTPKTELAELEFPTIPSKGAMDEAVYSSLTGKPLASIELKNTPTFCIQIPNGTDGGRPQAGLTQAGVIYEAIAEAGITRFDAVFEDPTSAVIGPIRSLRVYYLDFAAPFGCTVVHAGGPDDAVNALRNGGYRELDESYQYMYRSSAGGRLWNNLFTTSEKLKEFNKNNGYNTSDIKGFARMTPEESEKSRIDKLAVHKLSITKQGGGNTSELEAEVSDISLSFQSTANFNVKYSYDLQSNTYKRAYQSGAMHEVYECPNENLGEKAPESICKLTVLSPSVVVAMIVPEKRAADNYHEDITMVGVGDAYIFQNGTAIKANWSKPARDEQIKFTDGNGNEIKLAPGQTFVSAVPNYGSVDY